MLLQILGDSNSHLGQTLAAAAHIRGVGGDASGRPVVMVAEDVLDHNDITQAATVFNRAAEITYAAAIILVSQVPPGTTRRWAKKVVLAPTPVFYQVDTIIMRTALARMVQPEQIVVGCADPSMPVPLEYQEFLFAFDCNVKFVTYEEAELAKCAINFCLAKQIEAANDLANAAAAVRANYDNVLAVLQDDRRIGPYAYMRPGKANQHLNRDVHTINQLAPVGRESKWGGK